MSVVSHPTALRPDPDAALVAGVRTGHDRAFDAIVDRYRGPLTGYARRLLGTAADDAEDVVQDALMRALAALRRSERPISLSSWLHRIVHNACVDHRRRPGCTVAIGAWEAVLGDGRQDPHTVAAERETLAELAVQVRALPTRQRAALLGVAVAGDSHEQVAARLGVSVAATKSLVHRARGRLTAAA